MQRHGSKCIIVLYSDGSKVPIRLSRRGKSCLFYTRPSMFGLDIVRRRYDLAYSTQFLIRRRLVPGNVVMVATDMYGKNPYGS